MISARRQRPGATDAFCSAAISAAGSRILPRLCFCAPSPIAIVRPVWRASAQKRSGVMEGSTGADHQSPGRLRLGQGVRDVVVLRPLRRPAARDRDDPDLAVRRQLAVDLEDAAHRLRVEVAAGRQGAQIGGHRNEIQVGLGCDPDRLADRDGSHHGAVQREGQDRREGDAADEERCETPRQDTHRQGCCKPDRQHAAGRVLIRLPCRFDGGCDCRWCDSYGLIHGMVWYGIAPYVCSSCAIVLPSSAPPRSPVTTLTR